MAKREPRGGGRDKRPKAQSPSRRKAIRFVPWYFSDQPLQQVHTLDGSKFVPESVMAKAVADYQERIARDGPLPLTEEFQSPSADTLQGQVRRIYMVRDTVFLNGVLQDTPAGRRVQKFQNLVFGYAGVGVPEFDPDVGRFVYTSLRIIVISALEDARTLGGRDGSFGTGFV